LGVRIQLDDVPHDLGPTDALATILLFAESNSRFVCEVPVEHSEQFESLFGDLPCRCLGEVVSDSRLHIEFGAQPVVSADIGTLKQAWQAPLRWN
jgi:phosphoribosylformylglycinamidine synthase